MNTVGNTNSAQPTTRCSLQPMDRNPVFAFFFFFSLLFGSVRGGGLGSINICVWNQSLGLIELLESLMAGVWTSDYKYAELMRNHFICILRSCLHCVICTQQNFAVYSILISRRCVAICSTLSIEAAESVVDLAFTNVAAIRSSSLVSRYIYY
jgi:hypothetical protein